MLGDRSRLIAVSFFESLPRCFNRIVAAARRVPRCLCEVHTLVCCRWGVRWQVTVGDQERPEDAIPDAAPDERSDVRM